ncbi:septation protein A [Pseudaeromonas paramecii]|uniref:Inner membrane-spanning protein YciB n=1 Tax=Pseudaeromonas paramecii TaxID=2138166 RepID=A0ABP8Q4W1_9GAMM
MKQLFEFIPLLVFFALYKLYDIYVATAALMVVTLLQMAFIWFRHGKLEKMHWVTLVLILVFGGFTLLLHDDAFIKWKVTVINLLFAGALLISQWGFNKPLIKQMLGKELQLPDLIWRRVNLAWAGFFALCAALNTYIAFHLPQDVWVNFKVFGLLGMTLVFTLLTVFYLYRHLPEEKE